MSKKIVMGSFFSLFLLLMLQCNQKKSKETKTNIHPETSIMNQEKNNLVGGWKSIEVSETVTELANYVMKEKQITGVCKKISNVSEQIVSGKNYKFSMHLENGEIWEALVYISLQKERKIMEFNKVNH